MTSQADGNSAAEKIWHSDTPFRLSGKQTGEKPCREADNLTKIHNYLDKFERINAELWSSLV